MAPSSEDGSAPGGRSDAGDSASNDECDAGRGGDADAELGPGQDPPAATLTGRDRVLVVDDEPGAGDLTATYLDRLLDDIETVAVTSPEAALEALRTRPVDCIVSDHDMPTATGLDLLADVRSEIGDVPFLLFTGKGSEEIASEAISAGVTDYLQKGGGSDQFEMLANRVRNALDHRRAEADLREVNEKVTAIHEFATDVSGVDTAVAVFRRVVDVADEVLELDRCVAAERDGDRIYPAAISESVSPEEVRPFAVGEGIVGKTVAEERPFVIDGVSETDDAEPLTDTIASAISVPIGEYGAFQAVSNERAAFDDSDVEFAELVASHAREALEQIETERTLRQERDRLASLFESLPWPVARISVDRTGQRRLDGTNDAFESTFGRAAGRDTLSETGDAIVPPGERSVEPNQFDESRSPIRTEVKRRTVAGVRDFILNAIPTERGEETCVYVVYTDIDEQKRVERTPDRLHETS